ncbi:MULTISPECIES: phosphodiester glycosidase family protein [Tabrizicola]|uniref:phosphodiester glycosidase family protein n=1 Tax=Tabrizicola TaxID=1443919 RepID=UPI0010806241|nr:MULTISPECIES: phosphodiester glycosidase family protein [Paracoccaceae]
MLRLALALILAPLAAGAATCRDTVFEGMGYTVCEVAAGEDLRLFRSGPDGAYGSFRAVNQALEAEGKSLGFAMNAGMYHRDLSPVGLYIEDGSEQAPLVTRDGPGNFGMLPNGVFCWDGSFRIIESRAFKADRPACRYATQSGPMLVIGGKLHPRFLADSDSRYIRNGVGVSRDGSRAVFAISNGRVNFHDFARFFRDAMRLDDALYFDGNISRLYAPELGRHDGGFPMGPIVGTVVPKG